MESPIANSTLRVVSQEGFHESFFLPTMGDAQWSMESGPEGALRYIPFTHH
jgi:hypothetical protein